MVLAQIENFKYKFPSFFFWLGENDKKVHTISDESKFGNANEIEVNEPMNPKFNIKRF